MKRLTTHQMLRVEGGRVSSGGGTTCACGTQAEYAHLGFLSRLFGNVAHALFH